MNIHIVGLIVVALEFTLLMIWVRSIFFVKNGTDPAGKGMAIPFLLALSAWVLGGIILLLLKQTWSTIVVLIMGGIPLVIVIIGLIKQYGSRNKNY